jgi:hypothetical protein
LIFHCLSVILQIIVWYSIVCLSNVFIRLKNIFSVCVPFYFFDVALIGYEIIQSRLLNNICWSKEGWNDRKKYQGCTFKSSDNSVWRLADNRQDIYSGKRR